MKWCYKRVPKQRLSGKSEPAWFKLVLRRLISCIGSIALLSICSAHGASLLFDFDSGTPPGTQLSGNAIINPTTGVNNSGVLRLTPVERERIGGFVVDELDPGGPVAGFILNCRVLMGGGGRIGADGMSFNVGDRFSHLVGEGGIPKGLTVCLDTFMNEGSAPPAIIVRYNGVELQTVSVPGMRRSDFSDFEIKLDGRGLLNVSFDGKPVVRDLQVAFKPIARAKLGIAARTGGSMDQHLIDDLSIVTIGSNGKLPIANVVAETVRFLHQGDFVKGYLFSPKGKGPFPAVIFNAASSVKGGTVDAAVSQLAASFVDKGYAFFLPGEIRGAGSTDEMATCLANASKIQSATGWLRAQPFVDESHVFVIAASEAAVAAILACGETTDAASLGVQGMVLLGPPTSQWTLSQEFRGTLEPAVRTAACPILLVQAYAPGIQSSSIATMLKSGLKDSDYKIAQVNGSTVTDIALTSATWLDETLSFLSKLEK